MNAGFSNLDTLRKQLLAKTMADDNSFDAVITLIGLGMAAKIENYCNRKFMRKVGEQDILPADRANFLLSRYPVETVAQVELKMTEADGFIVQPASFYNTIDFRSGIVMCPDGADPGPYYAQVRFTYTGGYFWEQLEPDDSAFPTDVPTGANLLPDDLRLAWFLQCQQVWDARDKLGLGLVDKPGEQTKLDELKLSPLVEGTIKQYVRPNLV